MSIMMLFDSSFHLELKISFDFWSVRFGVVKEMQLQCFPGHRAQKIARA